MGKVFWKVQIISVRLNLLYEASDKHAFHLLEKQSKSFKIWVELIGLNVYRVYLHTRDISNYSLVNFKYKFEYVFYIFHKNTEYGVNINSFRSMYNQE